MQGRTGPGPDREADERGPRAPPLSAGPVRPRPSALRRGFGVPNGEGGACVTAHEDALAGDGDVHRGRAAAGVYRERLRHSAERTAACPRLPAVGGAVQRSVEGGAVQLVARRPGDGGQRRAAARGCQLRPPSTLAAGPCGVVATIRSGFAGSTAKLNTHTGPGRSARGFGLGGSPVRDALICRDESVRPATPSSGTADGQRQKASRRYCDVLREEGTQPLATGQGYRHPGPR